MDKILACLKPRTLDETGSVSGAVSTTSASEGRKVAYVELLRRSSEPLGLVVEGGKDRNQRVHISHLRPGGVAEKSLALQTGDLILSINGTPTDHLMYSEVSALLENAGNVVNLEIAYDAGPDEGDNDEGTLKKTAIVSLVKEQNSFGFTISGGSTENRPITVSHVVVGSAPFRHGTLKVGDRVLKINQCDVSGVSQLDAVTVLQSSGDTCTLEMEYDVTVHEGLSESRGPLQVELLKPKGTSLGISLSGALHLGQPMYISKVKAAGIADRCGALHVGDQLVSVNGVTLENKTIRDAVRLLAKSDLNVRLEIIPAHNLAIVPDLSQEEALSDTISRLSDHHSTHHHGRQSQLSGGSSHPMLCHPETMKVRLKTDDIGFGLSLHGGVSGRRYRPIKIAVIEDGGPAALAGVLQVGDRIIAMNGVNVDGVATAHQALKLVQEGGDQLDMEVVFDVTDAVVPTSGTFDVKMVKTASLNLGITINGSNKREDNIWISSIRKGSIACRMGTLTPGDVILAINGRSLEQCNLREAAHILRNAGDIVTLTISKECSEKPTTGLSPREAVIFSVELHPNGAPLGISLTGSNHQPQPVFIAKIVEGGVAHRTGALKVGDRIMAINGQSLFGKTLRDALFLLKNAGDTVTLRISKLNRRKYSRPKAWSPTNKFYHHRQRYRNGHSSPPRHYGHLSRNSSSFGSSPLGGMRARRLSSTTIASSVSGTATPDSPHSYLPAPSPRQFSRYREHQYQFKPSDHSAFNRLPPLEDDDQEFDPERVHSHHQYHHPSASRYSSAGLPYTHSPTEALRARQRSLLERNNLAETDDEILHEDEVVRFHRRRTSLPVYPISRGRPGQWDFKTRALPYCHLPVGRVTPLTSDHEHGGPMAAHFVKQKSHSELGAFANRPSSGTPPDKAGSIAGDSQRQSPQKLEQNSAELEEEERGQDETEEREGREAGEGGEESESDEQDEEEREDGEEVPDVQGVEWEGDMDNENGAKAVHTDSGRPIPLTVPPSSQPSSATTSTSTPNSLSRPKRAPLSKTRTPSVPVLPTSLLTPDAALSVLPECLGEFERTLQNARNYMKEFKALAESGSSDPESEPESLSTQLKAVKLMEQISSAAKLPALMEYRLVCLHKDSLQTDLGFSLSDGIGEPGVYVKSIHSGGLAEMNGELQPFDRIMKINDVVVRDHDCCRVVPLLQELKDDVNLLIARNTLSRQQQT